MTSIAHYKTVFEDILKCIQGFCDEIPEIWRYIDEDMLNPSSYLGAEELFTILKRCDNDGFWRGYE